MAILCDLSTQEEAATFTVSAYRRRFSGVVAPTALTSLLQGGDLVSFSVQVIASNTDSVIFTDASGSSSAMRVGESINYSVDEQIGKLEDANVSIELTNGADVVSVIWEERT